MIINIKVDSNDADFIYIKSEMDENDIADIRLMADAIKKFKPYKGKSRANLTHEHSNNFPNGERFSFNMWRDDLGGKSPFDYYVNHGKIVSEKVFNTFKKYIKERSFHTIYQIKLDKEIIFKRERW